MERDNNSQNKKRTRDDDHDHDDGYENNEYSLAHKSKKPAESVVKNNSTDQKPDEFCDRIGVFDFPWLKEGVVFKADEYLEPEEKFAPCLYPPAINLDHDESCVGKKMFVDDGKSMQEKKVDDDEDSFNWSLKVDDLEPVDNCIWSFVIDQPLSIGLNKV